MPRKPAVAPESTAASRARRVTAKTVAARPAAKQAGKPAVKRAAKPAARDGVTSAVKAAAQALAGPASKKPSVLKPVAKKPVAKKTASKAVGMPPSPPERAASETARPTLVRDSFTMPEQEYAVLLEVKQACLRAGIDVKKSELLRIGVALLGQLDLTTLQAVLAALPQLKTGRPPAD